MKAFVWRLAGVLVVVSLVTVVGCSKVKAPPMPKVPNPVPAADADPLQVERYQLLQEKQALDEKYGDNIERIKQINNRLIEINLELRRQGINP